MDLREELMIRIKTIISSDNFTEDVKIEKILGLFLEEYKFNTYKTKVDLAKQYLKIISKGFKDDEINTLKYVKQLKLLAKLCLIELDK